MRKNKKDYLRSILALFFSLNLLYSERIFSKNITLKVGESTQLNIESDEQMKVKGGSIHVVDLRSNHYQIIGIKKGVAIIDPTPLSRSQPPMIVEVLSTETDAHEQGLNCSKLSLSCKNEAIHGEITKLNQLAFLHDQSRHITDFTEGIINSESDPVLKTMGIISIQKFMGRQISIRIRCSEGAESATRAYWRNFRVQIICENSKARQAIFFFEIEKLDDDVKSNRSISKNLLISATDRDEIDKKIISYAEKKLLISDTTNFDFKVQSLSHGNVTLNFEVQGKIKFLDSCAAAMLSAGAGSTSAKDEARSEILIPYDTKVLLSDTESSDQLSEAYSLAPWSHLPIVGILFRNMARTHSRLKQKISLIISSETPVLYP